MSQKVLFWFCFCCWFWDQKSLIRQDLGKCWSEKQLPAQEDLSHIMDPGWPLPPPSSQSHTWSQQSFVASQIMAEILWLDYRWNRHDQFTEGHSLTWLRAYQIRSDQISRSVVSDSLQPSESQHARPPCPSPTPGVHSDSRPSSQ